MLSSIILLALANAAQASGKKQEIDPNCSLTRVVNDQGSRAVVATLFQKFPYSNVGIGILLPKKSGGWPTTGALDVVMGSETSAAKLDYEITRTGDGRSKLTINLPPTLFRNAQQPSVILKGEGSPLEISTAGWTDAFAWLTACREKQIAATEIPFGEINDEITPAVSSPDFWITDSDMARLRGQFRSGIVYRGYMIWRIELDGTVKSCRFLNSTGNATLDNHICGLMISRGRYLKPAVDSQGNNVVSWGGRQMVVSF